jgi:hypothetical protein
MNNFIVIFICFFMGFFCRNLKNFPPHSVSTLNSFIIFLSLPALILFQVPKLLMTSGFLQGHWWIPVSMAWISFLASVVVFVFLGKKFQWSRPKIGALILTAGLGNTSFVGFPILEALIGHEAIPVGVIVDQAGSFLVLSTLGIVVAAIYSGTQVSSKMILKRILTFPPFLSLVMSIAWVLLGGRGHVALSGIFERISLTLVPLALFSFGLQIKVSTKILKKRWRPLLLGLFFKLFFLPALFTLLYWKGFSGANDLTIRVTILEAAMATMFTSAVVATEFNLDGELAQLMVGVGVPLSLITVSFWNYILFLK